MQSSAYLALSDGSDRDNGGHNNSSDRAGSFHFFLLADGFGFWKFGWKKVLFGKLLI